MKARKLLAIAGIAFAVISLVWTQVAIFGPKDGAGHADGRWVFEAFMFTMLSAICVIVRGGIK